MYGKRKLNIEKSKFNLKRSTREGKFTYSTQKRDESLNILLNSTKSDEINQNNANIINNQQNSYLQPIKQTSLNSSVIVKKAITPTLIRPSNINVMKKCLLIGINYTGTNLELEECINDCENLRNFLINSKYFASNEITMMTDFTPGLLYPSKKNILAQLDSLVKYARKYPTKQIALFVSYSGYGHCVKDIDNDKNDIMDDVICPIDFQRSGHINDNDLKSKFINMLPSNVKLIILVDACHTTNMMDLKYSYRVDDKNTYTVIGKLPPTVSNVIAIDGCTNHIDNKGALIASFLANYRDGISYSELVSNMRIWLKDNQSNQFPYLSSGKLIEIDTKFLLELYR